jgi:tRNA (guanine37-N1)-methyltransferase
MRFDIMTLFPDMVETVLSESIIGRAREAGIIEIHTHNIRDYSNDKHRRVDDTPYGGGMGMLMRVEPVYACHKAIKEQLACRYNNIRTVYMSPQGSPLTQKKAEELLVYDAVIILCGHYEGIDRRAVELVADAEISAGDYILTGGEMPACILVDCVSRMVEGVLADSECYERESIACGMLEYPQYTRPPEFMGKKVPDVLLGGNHAEIERWRYRAALELTKTNRPDLL